MWYGIILAIGLITLGVGVYLLMERVKLLKSGVVVNGKVIEVLEGRNSDNELMYEPVFAFKTTGNREISMRQGYSSKPSNYDVGDEVKLVYQENEPEKAMVLSYFSSFGLMVILAAVAMPMIVIGGGYFFSVSFFRNLAGIP